jgi:hypothetical protein
MQFVQTMSFTVNVEAFQTYSPNNAHKNMVQSRRFIWDTFVPILNHAENQFRLPLS